MTTTSAATKLSLSIGRRQSTRGHYFVRLTANELASKGKPNTPRVTHSDTGQNPKGNYLAIMAVLVLFLPHRRLIYE